MKFMKKEKISIITPVYNCEKLIEKTIECVLNQTYKNWEWLLVDDCSPDNSAIIIKKYAKNDNRIKYFKLSENSGAAVSRNKALAESTGRFVAYLDADDLWKNDKLEKQVKFMLENQYSFTCTDYEKITETGNSLNKIIKIPKKVDYIDYNFFLRNTIIQTVGVMVDTKLTGKELLKMPNIRRRQDAATWCQLLKNGHDCYECPENLSYYRVVTNSLSSNKFKAIKMNWYWYRTCYCFIGYAFNGVRKRIYIKR
uniref:Glycosyltransferase n=1 Tax=Lactococcus lactis TaxID=1358 RepID=A0A451F087_9LACT|nr:glycosyltransferase [Lactococcus lactis]